MYHQHVQDHHFMRAESYKLTIIKHRDKKSKVFAIFNTILNHNSMNTTIFNTILNHNSMNTTIFNEEKFRNHVRTTLEKPAISILNKELKEYLKWLVGKFNEYRKPCRKIKNIVKKSACGDRVSSKHNYQRIEKKKEYVEKVQEVVNKLDEV